MESRLIIAYSLCAIMLLILAALTVRYLINRRQFKIRQSGRGKTTNVSDSFPAE
ncbi:MAG TPA: hypothetical protein PKK17_13780 [Sphingorhabdus lacus]|jgi:hypothetical protein|uniref:hypothetical protein n=1 Tax=Sphingorhabdus lacus TaxID=392610 RepID=UPI00131C141B|nr:hypothetical protein [Sphingorhabdus lacus]HNW19572.1 hypothetical protein [Sphingorhabdus lacus]HPV68956.1 hypothetical protein [Sphingorhabdus lacus]